MTDRDLDAAIRRMTQSRINRRGFLAATGLGATSAFLAACSSNGSGATAAPSSGASTAPTEAPSAEASAAPPADIEK